MCENSVTHTWNVMESHKFCILQKNQAQLHKIYVIFAFKLRKIHINCVIPNRPAETLNGHLHTSTNDELKTICKLRLSSMYHERVKLHLRTMRKLYVVAV